jgi:hypothetical protein
LSVVKLGAFEEHALLFGGTAMTNPIDNQFDFAGVGFTVLDLDTGKIAGGSILDGTEFQPLTEVTFNDATGVVSFRVATSRTVGVRNISFTGNVIDDSAGNAIGFTGTWKGERIPVIAEPTAAVTPPPDVVEGLWAAVVDRHQIQ